MRWPSFSARPPSAYCFLYKGLKAGLGELCSGINCQSVRHVFVATFYQNVSNAYVE